MFKSLASLLLSLVCSSAYAQTDASEPLESPPVFRGEGYSLGFQHGQYYKSEIRDLVESVIEAHLPNWYHRLYSRFLTNRMVEKIPQVYLDEMRGIAEGAGVDYEDILFGNLLPDINALAGNPFACSTFAISGERSQTGSMLIGRNLDWYYKLAPFMRKNLRTYVLAGPDTKPVMVFGYPGMVGILTGINDSGLFMSLMYSDSSDQTSSGLPVTFLYRMVLESSETVAEARGLIETTKPRTIAINTLVADGKDAIVAEMTANRESFRYPEGGALISANHFESPMLQNIEQRDYRWPVLTQLLGSQEVDTLGEVRTVTGDTAMLDETWLNVKAVLIDYSSGSAWVGSTGDRAAHADLSEVNWREILTGLRTFKVSRGTSETNEIQRN